MNTPKILLVEDEQNLVKALDIVFNKAGFEVTASFDGVDALDKLKQTNPDIILLDVLMPRMNGFIFLEKIKQDKNLKNIPVIIFSNYTTTEYVKKGLSLGAVDFIGKTSITLNELINKINGHLKNRVERQ
ncbi:MAG: two component transcriptional regulator, winged helix family, two-component system, OmpR family, response regulator VicR [Candidatus Azambacteria bacterium GW2011_GWC1_46_13]|uniref:Two component transcriptional regulator, winged helix family, two-component system, OmpR family, response regulator VicR n=2 Tax=Candidatus Azamiibacteriota TaxID=1752741 RepID=A0A0G1RKS7_9BACT|nr:MAG: two component transcriptional regulator, winged helix family, two-component system, OmpR family, response regulator VicR [Candidatus Azambacteria bacterium GW2011_GWC1_46_13]